LPVGGQADLRLSAEPRYGLAKSLVASGDVWLNTPLPPLGTSRTSEMKAALNGVLNLSTLGGWRIEACIDGVNRAHLRRSPSVLR